MRFSHPKEEWSSDLTTYTAVHKKKIQWKRRKIPAFRVGVLLLIPVSECSAKASWNTGIRTSLLHYISQYATRRQKNVSCGDHVCPTVTQNQQVKHEFSWNSVYKFFTKKSCQTSTNFHQIRYTNSLQKSCRACTNLMKIAAVSHNLLRVVN